MYVPLSGDKHRFVQDSSLCTLEIQDNIRDKFFSDNFFCDNFFLGLNFTSEWILSWTKFCLGLHAAVVFRTQSFHYTEKEPREEVLSEKTKCLNMKF